MSKTYLKNLGSNVIAEHDVASPFTFELQNEDQVKMTELNGIGTLFVGDLVNSKAVREIPISAVNGVISYTIDDLLPDSYYGLSFSIAGYVFPSSSQTEIRVRRGNEALLVDEIKGLGLTKIEEEARAVASTFLTENAELFKGPAGVQGAKPVAGVDYFTESDKTAIVTEVVTDSVNAFNENVTTQIDTFNTGITTKMTELANMQASSTFTTFNVGEDMKLVMNMTENLGNMLFALNAKGELEVLING